MKLGGHEMGWHDSRTWIWKSGGHDNEARIKQLGGHELGWHDSQMLTWQLEGHDLDWPFEYVYSKKNGDTIILT